MSFRARRPRAVVSAATGVRGARAASARRVPQKGPSRGSRSVGTLRPSAVHAGRPLSQLATLETFEPKGVHPRLFGARVEMDYAVVPHPKEGSALRVAGTPRCLAAVESDSSSQGSRRAGERRRDYLAHECGTDRPSQGQHTSRQQCPGGRRRSCEPGGTERCGLDVSCAPP